MKSTIGVLILTAGILLVSCTSKRDKAFEAFNTGKEKYQKNLVRESIPWFTKALEYMPEFDQALFYRANAYNNLRITDSAMADYDKCIAASPGFPDVWANRGTLKFQLGDRDGACSDWNKAKELGKDNMELSLMNCTK